MDVDTDSLGRQSLRPPRENLTYINSTPPRPLPRSRSFRYDTQTRRSQEVQSHSGAHTIPNSMQHYIYQIAKTLKPISLILAGDSPFVARRIPQRGKQSIASRRCRWASIRWVALLLWLLLWLLLLLLGLLFSSHLVHQPCAYIEKHGHSQAEENKEHRLS